MPNPWEKYAAPATASGPWAKYGAPPPAAPEDETPGFGGRLAESFGIPTSQKQATSAVEDALQHPSELFTGASGVVEHLLRSYGNQLDRTFKEYKSNINDIADRLKSKQIDHTEAMKQLMNEAQLHAVKALPLFGSTLFNYGKDIQEGNYAGAAGGGLGFAAQVAGPKALEVAGPRLAASVPDSLKNYTPAGDIPELLKRTVVGQTFGRLPGVSLLEKLGSNALTRPTLKEWWQALKPDAQLSLFNRMPKLGDTPISPETHPATLSFLQENSPETTKPFQAGGSTVPRVYTGEAVINDALTSLDKPTLIRIAKARGIDTTTEANLIPSKAEASLVPKIKNSMTFDELADAREVGLEVSRNKPVPGENLGKKAMQEAWHYKVVKQFFPDVDLPQAMEKRAQATIAKRPTSADYTPIYRAAAQKASPAGATDAEVNAKAENLKAQDQNMEALLRQMVTQAQAGKTAPEMAATEQTATAEGRSAQAEAARAGSKYMKPSEKGFGKGEGIESTPEGERLMRQREERDAKRKGTLGEMR